MITAETPESGIKIEIGTLQSTALPGDIGSYYHEFLIINYLNEDIYAVDYQNKPILIKQHEERSDPWYRKLEVRSRHHNGKRTYDPFRRYETTPSKHEIMSISYDVLRQQPIFVEELNAVLCFADQLSITLHPHSKEAVAERTHQVQEATAEILTEAPPFVLIANDPSGVIKELFVLLNGHICSARVTHFVKEADNVVIGFRNKTYSAEEFTRHRTTFKELRQQDEKVWHLAGFQLSSNRSWFEHVIAVDSSQKPDYVSMDTVNALIKKARLEDALTIHTLQDENKEAKRRLGVIETAYDELRDGDYQDTMAQVDQTKLDLEYAKLKKLQADAESKLAIEQLKVKKELIATIGTVAKTAAIMVPVGIGIYKAVQAFRKT